MQILKKNYVETATDVEIGLGGSWKVAVVDAATGHEHYPLGEEFRPNLILNQGLDMFVGHAGQFFQSNSGHSSQAGTILGIATARCGTNNTAAAVAQTGLISQTQSTVTPTPGYACTSVRNVAAGSSTFTKSFDFSVVTSGSTLYEAAISADGTNSGGAGSRIFTRFTFAPSVTLVAGQFLRLIYALKCSIPATLAPIPVTLENGGFVGNGSIKAVGTFAELFGTLTTNGLYQDSAWAGQVGYMPAGWGGAGLQAQAYLLSSTADFPAVDTATSLTSEGVTINKSPNVTSVAYVAGSGTRALTYIFPAANPVADAVIGGILFNAGGVSGGARLTDGWLWKFDVPQTKHATKALVVNMTTTITRL